MAGKRRRTKKSKMRIALLLTILFFVFLILGAMMASYMVFGTYKGLGRTYKIPFNPYRNKYFVEEKGMISYDDKNYTSVPGIDVSSYQGEIDWDKVKEQGVGFAIIKIGYSAADNGKIYKDSRFSYNYNKANNAGIDVGIYFFSQAMTTADAVREAKYVVRQIRGKNISMPVAYDMEYTEDNRVDELTVEERTEIADAFCTIIEENGYQPMVYGNPQWLLQAVDLTYLSKYPIWLAHYTDKSEYPYDYKIWQYTDRGKIEGIPKKVDLDIYLKEN